MPQLSIAIDGPASSGKGTVARGLAERLGYTYVDTGAMYRTVALSCLRQDVPLDDASAVAEVARDLVLGLRYEHGTLRVWLGDEEVTAAIRADEVGRGASDVAVHPPVRRALLMQQRTLGAAGGVVMDGRDIGTVVLPDAQLKVYLDADLDVRARRRHAELTARGQSLTLEEVRAAIAARDAQDSGRETAPLAAADDAVRLDTTALGIDEVVDQLAELAFARGAERPR